MHIQEAAKQNEARAAESSKAETSSRAGVRVSDDARKFEADCAKALQEAQARLKQRRQE